ncbi:hypothetical protein PCE1_002151 [Barthelona sp. PCE]
MTSTQKNMQSLLEWSVKAQTEGASFDELKSDLNNDLAQSLMGIDPGTMLQERLEILKQYSNYDCEAISLLLTDIGDIITKIDYANDLFVLGGFDLLVQILSKPAQYVECGSSIFSLLHECLTGNFELVQKSHAVLSQIKYTEWIGINDKTDIGVNRVVSDMLIGSAFSDNDELKIAMATLYAPLLHKFLDKSDKVVKKALKILIALTAIDFTSIHHIIFTDSIVEYVRDHKTRLEALRIDVTPIITIAQ